MAKKNDNIVKFNRGVHFNIGFVVFFVIIIYVVFHIFTYITSNNISEYEVKQGSIATNNIYKGLIIRDETVVKAEQSGYVNYYIKNATKASILDVVYSVDTDGGVSSQISAVATDNMLMTEDNLSEFINDINGFSENYDGNYFHEVYSFKQKIGSALTQTLSQNALYSLTDQVEAASANNTFFTYKPERPGVIYYSIDGYEDLTLDNFTVDDYNNNTYTKTDLDINDKITVGDPAYKIINSDNWNIVVAINDQMAEELNEKSALKIRFIKDDFTTNVGFNIIRRDNKYFLNLELKNSLVRYLNNRYVDIELVLNSDSGLKIPNSAITKKEFFTIPKKCFVPGMDSSDLCLMLAATGKETADTRITPTIYYESEDYYYIDSEDVNEGDVLLIADSLATYTVGSDKDELVGVYNINKGYAVFKQIKVISSNDDYSIVEPKTDYGIAIYDHIALDGSSIEENQTIR